MKNHVAVRRAPDGSGTGRKRPRRAVLCAILSAAVCCAFAPFAAAGAAGAVPLAGEPARNLSAGDYTVRARTVRSYLAEEPDGTLLRAEADEETVLLETYSADGTKLLSVRRLGHELPIFGGFFAGTTYNYLVYGQENPEESDKTEVVRVVRYDKDWNRLGSASLYGANTSIPFRSGSLRMAQADGRLYVHTCHQMYKSADGLNHQANLTFIVRESDFTVTDARTGVSNIRYGYVSHSFNQFVAADGDTVCRADHGDAYPRGLSVTVCPAGDRLPAVQYTVPLTFAGEIGDNPTGCSLGGFGIGDARFLLAGNLDDQKQNYDFYYYYSGGDAAARNVFLLSVPKDPDGEAQTTFLTDYTDADHVTVRTPQLVKLSDGSFLLLWEETDGTRGTTAVRAVRTDETGAPQTEICTLEARLSDCQPILTADGCVTWYAGSDEKTILYKLDPTAPESFAAEHLWDDGRRVGAASCTADGETVFTCVVCGETRTEKTPAKGHTFSPWIPVESEDGTETEYRACAVCGAYEIRTSEIPPFRPGDPDGDLQVTAYDARLALRRSVGLETFAPGTPQFTACDADGNGSVTAADARSILRAAVGLEDPADWRK